MSKVLLSNNNRDWYGALLRGGSNNKKGDEVFWEGLPFTPLPEENPLLTAPPMKKIKKSLKSVDPSLAVPPSVA